MLYQKADKIKVSKLHRCAGVGTRCKKILAYKSKIKHVFSLLLSLLFTALPAQASTSLAFQITLLNTDIQLQLNAEEYRVINLQKGETNIAIPAIIFFSQQALSKGTVVLLSDLHTQQSAKSTFYKLAKTLPQWGWNTVLVTPKTEYFALLPEPIKASPEEQSTVNSDEDITASKASQQSNEQTDDTDPEKPASPANKSSVAQQTGLNPRQMQEAELGYTFNQYSTFVQLLMNQINTAFLQQAGYQLLMVEGKTATVAINFLNAESNSEINALIVNNPYWPEHDTNRSIPNMLAQLTLPVLDLVSFSDNQWSIQTQSNRVAQTRVKVKAYYRQREILGGQVNATHSEYIAREVIGWTRYLGW